MIENQLKILTHPCSLLVHGGGSAGLKTFKLNLGFPKTNNLQIIIYRKIPSKISYITKKKATTKMSKSWFIPSLVLV